jgi:hypothetical protein
MRALATTKKGFREHTLRRFTIIPSWDDLEIGWPGYSSLSGASVHGLRGEGFTLTLAGLLGSFRVTESADDVRCTSFLSRVLESI